MMLVYRVGIKRFNLFNWFNWFEQMIGSGLIINAYGSFFIGCDEITR